MKHFVWVYIWISEEGFKRSKKHIAKKKVKAQNDMFLNASWSDHNICSLKCNSGIETDLFKHVFVLVE